jgi:hypothetical protein
MVYYSDTKKWDTFYISLFFISLYCLGYLLSVSCIFWIR